MSLGWQEVTALLIVAAVVVLALYRRWRKRGAGGGSCGDCAAGADSRESTVRFYRRS